MTALWLMLLGFAGPDQEAAPELSFSFEECAPDTARDIERLLRADVVWAPGDPTMVLRFGCQPSGITLTLTVDDDQEAERFVAFAGIAEDARPRTVALIAAEMLLLGRGQATTVRLRKTNALSSAEPLPVTEAPPVVVETPPTATEPLPPFGLLAVAGLSLQGASPGVPLLALGGRFRFEGETTFGIAVDGAAVMQRRTVELGTALAIGGASSVVAEARAEIPRGWVRGGLGVRALAIRLSASPSAAELPALSAWGTSLGPMARLGFSWTWPHRSLDLIFDGGWCGPEVTGTVSGAPAIGIGGWWAGASLGVGWLGGD